jgi:type IV pilus assembly protein PilB
MLLYKGKGCDRCNHTGYKGRVGVYEVLANTPELAVAILKEKGKSEITEIARKQGMINIMEDAFIKARNGITTVDEIMRVTQR